MYPCRFSLVIRIPAIDNYWNGYLYMLNILSRPVPKNFQNYSHKNSRLFYFRSFSKTLQRAVRTPLKYPRTRTIYIARNTDGNPFTTIGITPSPPFSLLCNVLVSREQSDSFRCLGYEYVWMCVVWNAKTIIKQVLYQIKSRWSCRGW